jgi:hypothetical protein
MRDPAELLSAYFDDSLAEGELAELRAWLAGDRERLAQFVRASVIHSRLRDVLMQHDMRGLVFDGVFGDAVDPQHIAGLLDEEEEAAARRAREAEELARRQAMAAVRREEMLDRSLMRVEEPRVPRWLVYSSVAAAAALLVMAGRMMGPAQAPEPKAGPAVAAARAPVGTPAEPPIVAEVAKTLDATLRRGTHAVAAGAKLPAGALVVDRGVAEVMFAAGAKLVVEGPAVLELMTADRARLVRGRVVAYVPEQALGFTLHSQAASFVDLGTEFGVEIDAAGQASVHVLDGEIALVAPQKETPSRTLQRGAANEVSVDGAIRDIPFDEARFLRRVPASAYELAVLKSRPLAYWRLNETNPNSTLVSEGQLAASMLVSGGVATADNRAGRDAQGGRVAGGPAQAALFAGEHDGLETPGDAALGLVSDCTLEAWVLPTTRATGPQRIFSTFDRPRSGIAFGVVDGRWYKLPDDDLKFHLTVYGDYDCLSATPIVPDKWVHLAATIDAAGTPLLYVDGAAVERRFRPLGVIGEAAADDAPAAQPSAAWPAEAPTPVGRTTAGLARIGRNPVGSDGQVSPERFQGQISNVAVYDRVLGAKEIEQHVRATRDAATSDRDQQQ